MSSIRQVAKHAGVSISTVSRVFNNNPVVRGEVRERVLAAIKSCGYTPSVGRRSTSLLGLVYTSQSAFGSPYDMALIEGMGQAMESVGFDLVVLNPTRDKSPNESFTQYFLRKGVRGVILRATPEGCYMCEAVAEEKYPAVVVGAHFEHRSLRFVYADSFLASKQATEHLLSLGHKSIAYASCKFDKGDRADRFRGYLEAMKHGGVGWIPDLVYKIPPNRPDGARLLHDLMGSRCPPTAVYIAEPSLVPGLLIEARNMRVKIPQDISVVGFDDRDTRDCVYPRFTSVCQDTRRIGHAAFLKLAELIASPRNRRPTNSIETAWLELNDTTAPPPTGSVSLLSDTTSVTPPPIPVE